MSMASKSLEWLVIVYDKPVSQRLKFRDQHLQNMSKMVKAGIVTGGGPIFQDETKTQFAGSVFVFAAEKKSDVLDILKQDVYAKEGVWDLDSVLIHPHQPAIAAART